MRLGCWVDRVNYGKITNLYKNQDSKTDKPSVFWCVRAFTSIKQALHKLHCVVAHNKIPATHRSIASK